MMFFNNARYIYYMYKQWSYEIVYMHLRALHIVAEHHSHYGYYVARCLTWKACYCRRRRSVLPLRIIHCLYVECLCWCTRSCKCNQQTEKDKRMVWYCVVIVCCGRRGSGCGSTQNIREDRYR